MIYLQIKVGLCEHKGSLYYNFLVNLYFYFNFFYQAFYGPGQPFNFFAGKDISVRASVNLFDLSQDLSSQLTFESVGFI